MLGIKASATTNQTVAKEDVHDNDIKKAEELAIERNAALEKENAVVKKDVYDNDIRNAELVMDAHSVDPFEIMRIQQYDDVPMAKAGDDIVVRVEAATVSEVDCRIRDGTYKWKFGGKPSFPMCPGIDCVGIIASVGSLAIKSGLDVGDRVAAISMKGCTAKYVNLKIDEVIKVPDDVDAAEAATVIRTYTAAFQCLMYNFRGMNRYSRKPLSQDRVLVVGPCGVFERALVELALYLGAKRVYFSCVSANQKSHDMYIRMLGAKPLSKDPEDWSEELEGKIDIAIDSSCIDRYEHSVKSLNEDGFLMATGMRELEKSTDYFAGVEKMWISAWVAMNPKCYAYEGIIDNYHVDRKNFVKDLIFLFNALEKGKIKPKVASRIPMTKVAGAQERFDISSESLERRGAIVVEPWLVGANNDDEESRIDESSLEQQEETNDDQDEVKV